jgi:hypothetical protein
MHDLRQSCQTTYAVVAQVHSENAPAPLFEREKIAYRLSAN